MSNFIPFWILKQIISNFEYFYKRCKMLSVSPSAVTVKKVREK